MELISVDPAICHGQACIRGTRIPVSVVLVMDGMASDLLDCLAGGMSEGEIRTQYPTLPEAAVRAAVAYGALLAREELLPLEPSEG